MSNYLKWSLEYSWAAPKTNLVLVRETNEVPRHDLVVDVTTAGQLWLRVTKRGNEYECAHSTNGDDFKVAGKRTWGKGNPKYVGLLAKNGGNAQAAEIDVSIDSFEIRELGSLATGKGGADGESVPATSAKTESSDEPMEDAAE